MFRDSLLKKIGLMALFFFLWFSITPNFSSGKQTALEKDINEKTKIEETSSSGEKIESKSEGTEKDRHLPRKLPGLINFR